MTTSQFTQTAYFNKANELTLLEVAGFITEAFGNEAGAAWMRNTLAEGATDLLRKASFSSQFIFSESPEGFKYWSAMLINIDNASDKYAEFNGLERI